VEAVGKKQESDSVMSRFFVSFCEFLFFLEENYNIVRDVISVSFSLVLVLADAF
jgi:hypothetical protein